MRFAKQFWAKLTITLALLVALGGVGLAKPQQPISADAIAYLMAGGSWEDLCGNTDGPDLHGHCPACHLVAAAVLPAAFSTEIDPVQTASMRQATHVANVHDQGTVVHRRRSRAPPQA
ncbi:hypothetical protein [Loktanella sp. S4079]|uniref:hypothetical protein n=1 Tax=Loktanella sp. S4079 TaxID=579483 RepID=UPI0005FA6705|nr:hypothetical protein [Loktanella sp. S4079]KJZ19624.1 hypothetical protein TW80_01590 [Loktanella sp. S4079]